MKHSMCKEECMNTETLDNHAFKPSAQKICIKNVVKGADSGCLAVILLQFPYDGCTIVCQNPDC